MRVGKEVPAALSVLALIFVTTALGTPPAQGRAPLSATLPPVAEPIPTAAAVPSPAPETRTLRLLQADGTVAQLPLDDYVYGVVGGEMPAGWPIDALKAQAVAARTYALHQAQAGKHAAQGADVCFDSTCCQAYQTPEFLRDKWGPDSAFYEQKLRSAVSDTQGQVVTYGGALISAVYHASSAGSTNAAADVWGRAVPYLVSVESPGEESKGHGVGMSQWGARYLAEDGLDYRSILEHYYPGAQLTALP